jgi:PleD family two-component response regulator
LSRAPDGCFVAARHATCAARDEEARMETKRLLRKPSVLVVDDKRANLLALEAVLGDDYNTMFANSGEEAISLVETLPVIDVILMDVQMPDLDGFQTAARRALAGYGSRKPAYQCEPSQNGLFLDAPQRHSV